MIYQDSYYILQSGRHFYSNGGILGLGPDVKEGITEGYDGYFSATDEQPFTQEERDEIATEMIHRWIEWKLLERNR